jgi:dolichol-phosphate mannosyltransferase
VVVGERLSVVMPVYNEADVIEGLLEELDREVTSQLAESETIVVDDASTDDTARVLEAAAARFPGLRVERAERNRGHGPSVRRALELAAGDWIFQLDSDRQTEARDFWALWERRGEADLVLGVRVRRRDPRHRLVLSRVISVVVSLLVGRAVRDPNVPFRLIRRSLWEDARRFVGEDALAPSIYVTTTAVVRGWRVVETPIAHRPRAHGPSTLRQLRLVVFSLRGLRELLALRLRLARAGER